MNLNHLLYPKKSHRKDISFPSDTIALAEFLGIVFGDGGINNDWQLVISLNSKLDLEYSKYILNLVKKLFTFDAIARKRKNENTLDIVASSTSLVEFLISKGTARGNKILNKINIPKWIGKNNDYCKAFVRGLVDTDGCLYIHRHKIKKSIYINIGFCFTSYSPEIISSVAKILSENKIIPHMDNKNQRIYLYKEAAVIKYLTIFGSSNPRIFNKINKWRDARAV